MNYSTKELTQNIKKQALQIGFSGIGISKAEKLEEFDNSFKSWVKNGYNAKMDYMARNVEKRVDPTILVPGTKSVISLIASYYPEKVQPDDLPQISKYAYGADYHFVLKDMMQQLWGFIKEHFPELDGRMFVDSAPVSDKLWAVKAGLGWLGKNSCLINKELGSFVFICELIINVELDYDEPFNSNFCGSCTKCIDSCPTNAIVQSGVIDSNKCISYQTIENKEETIPNEFTGKFENRIFGCDICQDVCPWNKKPIVTKIEQFTPKEDLFKLDLSAWKNMTKEEFNRIFKNSPLKRAKHSGLQRNAIFISKIEK